MYNQSACIFHRTNYLGLFDGTYNLQNLKALSHTKNTPHTGVYGSILEDICQVLVEMLGIEPRCDQHASNDSTAVESFEV